MNYFQEPTVFGGHWMRTKEETLLCGLFDNCDMCPLPSLVSRPSYKYYVKKHIYRNGLYLLFGLRPFFYASRVLFFYDFKYDDDIGGNRHLSMRLSRRVSRCPCSFFLIYFFRKNIGFASWTIFLLPPKKVRRGIFSSSFFVLSKQKKMMRNKNGERK